MTILLYVNRCQFIRKVASTYPWDILALLIASTKVQCLDKNHDRDIIIRKIISIKRILLRGSSLVISIRISLFIQKVKSIIS